MKWLILILLLNKHYWINLQCSHFFNTVFIKYQVFIDTRNRLQPCGFSQSCKQSLLPHCNCCKSDKKLLERNKKEKKKRLKQNISLDEIMLFKTTTSILLNIDIRALHQQSRIWSAQQERRELWQPHARQAAACAHVVRFNPLLVIELVCEN